MDFFRVLCSTAYYSDASAFDIIPHGVVCFTNILFLCYLWSHIISILVKTMVNPTWKSDLALKVLNHTTWCGMYLSQSMS